jgi:arsenite methyltransferase
MSQKKATMFNKRAAYPKYKANQIIQTLSIKPGQTIADIGSGGGYYTLRFAQEVGKTGKVYAVDTNQEFLEFIKKQAAEQGVSTIITLLSSSEHPELPKHTLDYIFLRNVTHHLSNRVDYFQRLKETFKPNGKLVIIEYDGRGGFFSFQKRHRHFIPQDKLLEEMKQAGYVLQESYDFLSEQSFMIFTNKKSSNDNISLKKE